MPLINKTSFFQGDKTSYQLKASDLKSIAEYYAQKDIPILVNGENGGFSKDTAIIAMQSEIASLKIPIESTVFTLKDVGQEIRILC